MSASEPGEADPVASLAAFARVSYSELVTVALVSLLTALSALPVLTFGAGVLAATETMTAVVAGRGRGGPHHEPERLALFADAFRANLGRGLPYSLLFVAVALATAAYWALAVSLRSAWFLLGALLGGYALVVVLVGLYRAGSVVARSADAPGTVAALVEGAEVALAAPAFTALHLVFAGLVALLTALTTVGLVLLLPGLLAVLEVATFEELAGEGAAPVVRRYQRGDHD